MTRGTSPRFFSLVGDTPLELLEKFSYSVRHVLAKPDANRDHAASLVGSLAMTKMAFAGELDDATDTIMANSGTLV